MDGITQHWLDQGLRAASELMVCLVQSDMDEELDYVMEVAKKLVDKGAKS